MIFFAIQMQEGLPPLTERPMEKYIVRELTFVVIR